MGEMAGRDKSRGERNSYKRLAGLVRRIRTRLSLMLKTAQGPGIFWLERVKS
jgi:hypothetical protein